MKPLPLWLHHPAVELTIILPSLATEKEEHTVNTITTKIALFALKKNRNSKKKDRKDHKQTH